MVSSLGLGLSFLQVASACKRRKVLVGCLHRSSKHRCCTEEIRVRIFGDPYPQLRSGRWIRSIVSIRIPYPRNRDRRINGVLAKNGNIENGAIGAEGRLGKGPKKPFRGFIRLLFGLWFRLKLDPLLVRVTTGMLIVSDMGRN